MKIPKHPLPDKPQDLANKNIVIWGVGNYGGGLGSALFCQHYGAQVTLLDLCSADEMPEAAAHAHTHQWTWKQGDQKHPCLNSADLIIISPAVKPINLPDNESILNKCCSDLILFCHWHNGQRIGITGTKGKSSTAAICGQLCDWPVIGNSNQSVLSHLLESGLDCNVVIELSSFQLWYLFNSDARFTIGITTSIDRDHLDWHSSLEEYQACKLWLSEHGDLVISEKENNSSIREHQLYVAEQKIADCALLPLAGAHQHKNALLAIEAALKVGIEISVIQERLQTLKSLPHRQELVHQCGQLRFINDSAATTPIALLAALKTFTKPSVFILGGHDKGGDFSSAAAYIHEHNIPCILLGDAAAVLSEAGIHGPICESLEAAVETAVQSLHPSDAGNVVLSPGCASFGLFRSYIDRGEQFAAFARKRWPSGAGA